MAGRQRSRTPSDSGGVGHPLLPPTPERSDFSLTELLENQAAQEREAAAVLPFAFGKCTNPMGPGMRQAVYSCLTCNPNEGQGSRLGGVCSSCSIGCHADHELVELFSRRDFVCDCGTSRLGPSATCTLSGRTASTSEPHDSNRYDRTFVGEFCVCDRGKTYDPETEQDEMYQCLVCEDWRHAGCLGPHPHPDDFEALICAKCVVGNADVNRLLQRWVGAENSGVMICLGEGEDKLMGGLESVGPPKSEGGTTLPTVQEEDEDDEPPVAQPSSSSPYSGPVTLKRRAPPSLDSPSKRARASPPPTDCLAPNPPPPALDYLAAASPHENVYLAEGWRERWCTCKGPGGCVAFFDRLPCFLEEEDEVEVEEDEDSKQSLHDLGMKALASLPRDQAIDGLQAYAHLRDKMMQFLKPFAEGGQIVTKDAIQEFFEKEREARREALRGFE